MNSLHLRMCAGRWETLTGKFKKRRSRDTRRIIYIHSLKSSDMLSLEIDKHPNDRVLSKLFIAREWNIEALGESLCAEIALRVPT